MLRSRVMVIFTVLLTLMATCRGKEPSWNITARSQSTDGVSEKNRSEILIDCASYLMKVVAKVLDVTEAAKVCHAPSPAGSRSSSLSRRQHAPPKPPKPKPKPAAISSANAPPPSPHHGYRQPPQVKPHGPQKPKPRTSSSELVFHPSMSLEEFTTLLQNRGMDDKNIGKLKDKGLTAAKLTSMESKDLKELGLTMQGRQILKILLQTELD